MERQRSIAFVVCYFGRWPVWFPAFLQSCRSNPSVDWLMFTDCGFPKNLPPNVHVIPTTLKEVQLLVTNRLGFEVTLGSARKLCSLKPAYGVIFEEHLSDFDFWGFCDIDVIWGDIRGFWDDELLKRYDVLTTREGLVAGHMCILRNTADFRSLGLGHPEFRRLMQDPDYPWFDEREFSDWIGSQSAAGAIKVYWPRFMINFATPVDSQPSVLSPLDRYRWEEGHLYSLGERGKEILYLHFMNWKDSMKWCGLADGEVSNQFEICYSDVRSVDAVPGFSYRVRSRIASFKEPKLYVLYFFRRMARLVGFRRR